MSWGFAEKSKEKQWFMTNECPGAVCSDPPFSWKWKIYKNFGNELCKL